MTKFMLNSLLIGALSFFYLQAQANDEKSQKQSGLCLYAGYYQQRDASGNCPQPPQGNCSTGQIQCNPVLFSSGCVNVTRNPIGTSTQCREQSKQNIGEWVKSLSPGQREQFGHLANTAKTYFEQERRNYKRGQAKHPADVEADMMFTRYLNLEQLIDPSAFYTRNSQAIPADVAARNSGLEPIRVDPTSNHRPTNNKPEDLLPAAYKDATVSTSTSAESCNGPSSSHFEGCNDDIQRAVSSSLSGSCQLMLIETERFQGQGKSSTGTLTTYEWKKDHYAQTRLAATQVQLGRNGIGYGVGYESLALNPQSETKTTYGQTPSGFYKLEVISEEVAKASRCDTDAGSSTFNELIPIKKSSEAIGYSPVLMMLKYPVTYESSINAKTGHCIFISGPGAKPCGERGCVSLNSTQTETLSNWIRRDTSPALGVVTSEARSRLAKCVPGLSQSSDSPTTQPSTSQPKTRQ